MQSRHPVYVIRPRLSQGCARASCHVVPVGLRLKLRRRTVSWSGVNVTNTYDCIVLGLGGVGSAALYQLARRGVRCLGFEQFEIGHDQGSSHGQSRIIRKAYFEHPCYVPLLDRAYELWQQLERESGKRLFDRIGLAQFGPPAGPLITGIETSATKYNLAIERPSPAEFRRQYPQFVVPDEMAIIVERDAGRLLVERCVETHVQRAMQLGAQVHTRSRVTDIQPNADSITVVTDAARFSAARLIMTVGAWASQLLGLEIPLRVTRKHLHWYRVTDTNNDSVASMPSFFFEMPDGYFYGIPSTAGTIKVAEHSGGERVTDPADLSREIDASDLQRIEAFMNTAFQFPICQHTAHDVCMYTLTPDEHFVVDRHPQHAHISFAAGLSGHGFKFTPVLGAALADLALDGQTDLPIDFLSCSRF